MESETILIIFSCSVILKFIGLPYTLNIFKNVNPCIICVTMNYSFGNYLLSSIVLPNVEISFYNIKMHLLISLYLSTEKPLSIEKLPFSVRNTHFPKF